MDIKDIISTRLNLQFLGPLNDEGKNSTVMKAHDNQLDAVFIVKQIQKSSINNLDEYFNEAKIIYAVKHPNVVEIQHSTFDNDYIYLTMPYYQNGSLESAMNKKHLTVREILGVALDILSGLHYIHSKGLLHLDLKPTNILFANNGNALITDFGLSRYINEYGFATQTYLYQAHLAPESFSTIEKTVHYDIYAVGLILYRMCNGNDNFDQQYGVFSDPLTFKEHVQKGLFPNRKYFLPQIPSKLKAIIKKALEIDLSKRYNNCIEFMNALSSVSNESLDWQYTFDKNIHKWTYVTDKKTEEILYNPTDQTLFAHDISKTCTRRKTSLCKNNIDQTSAFKLIQNELK